MPFTGFKGVTPRLTFDPRHHGPAACVVVLLGHAGTLLSVSQRHAPAATAPNPSVGTSFDAGFPEPSGFGRMNLAKVGGTPGGLGELEA